MIRPLAFLLGLAFAGAAGTLPSTAVAQSQAPTRGELLYSTHCIACHATQMHWREKRQAVDWPTLVFQVRRFQGAAGLQWNDQDILEVARHLNDTIYRFTPPPRG